MRSTLHRFPLESRYRHALQNHRDLPNLCEDQERLPDVLVGSGVRAADASERYGVGVAERGTDERDQQGVLCAEHGYEGVLSSVGM